MLLLLLVWCVVGFAFVVYVLYWDGFININQEVDKCREDKIHQ